ncbi:MAG: archease [Candidatus Nanoarchaeia archaeon]|nr:archease [Candidatus Nanoarchaeia archaeon]
MKFRFLSHTADAKFEAYGKTLNKVFENSALAMFETITNTKLVNPKITKKFEINAKDNESILYDFLEHLLVLHETENILFSKFKVNIKDNSLKAEALGEKISKKRHEIRNMIKAVTYHDMKVSKTKNGYKAVVVVDL